jgi:hypothetical protein
VTPPPTPSSTAPPATRGQSPKRQTGRKPRLPPLKQVRLRNGGALFLGRVAATDGQRAATVLFAPYGVRQQRVRSAPSRRQHRLQSGVMHWLPDAYDVCKSGVGARAPLCHRTHTSAMLDLQCLTKIGSQRKKGLALYCIPALFCDGCRMPTMSAKALSVLVPRFATALTRVLCLTASVERKSEVKGKRVWHFIVSRHFFVLAAGCLRCPQKRCRCSCPTLQPHSHECGARPPVSNENRESKKKGSGTLLYSGTFLCWLPDACDVRKSVVGARAPLCNRTHTSAMLDRQCLTKIGSQRKKGLALYCIPALF